MFCFQFLLSISTCAATSRRESFGRLPSANTGRLSLGGAGGQLPSTSDKTRLSLGAPPGTANKENEVID